MAKAHGLAIIDGKRIRLNRIWKQMRQRCLNKNDSAYERYGGRGINICEQWRSFPAFYDWAMANGYREDLEIDRKDNSKGYSPENCRWVDLKTQARNKRTNHMIIFRGETKSMAEWAEIMKINYGALRDRIYALKWPTEKALTQPVRSICRRQ